MTEPEPFYPAVACIEVHGCPMTDPCDLRCHERFLNDEIQANDSWADAENAAAWHRYWDANPGEEEAMKAACDPKRALADHQAPPRRRRDRDRMSHDRPTPYAEMADVIASLPLLLREARRARGLSLRAAADELGMSFNTVTRIEKGVDCVLSNAVAVMRWLDQTPTRADLGRAGQRGMACEKCERDIQPGDCYAPIPGSGGLVQCGEHAANLGELRVRVVDDGDRADQHDTEEDDRG